MPFLRRFRCVRLTLFLAVVLGTGGCDNVIEPFAERGTYSLYGYLSPSRSLQMIRVRPLSVPITEVDSTALDVTVILENRTTGTSQVLQDSVITFQDARTTVITHNFWTRTPVRPDSRYRISVEGPEGTVTSATAVTPAGDVASISPSDGNCLSDYKVVFEDVNPRRVFDASVRVRYRGQWISLPTENSFVTKDGDAGLTFRPEDLLEDRIPAQPLPEGKNSRCWYAPRCSKLESDTLRVQYTYLGPEWYGSIPEDSLTYDPLRSYDVSNGLGFFGALGQARTSVTVDTARAIPINDQFCDH